MPFKFLQTAEVFEAAVRKIPGEPNRYIEVTPDWILPRRATEQ